MVPSVNIPEILTNARAFRWRDDTMLPSDFTDQIESFLAQLNENDVDYLLVGGVALLQYTSGRNTEDIDLILAKDELRKIPGYETTEANDLFATGSYRDLRVEILRAEHPFFQAVKTRFATERDFHGHRLKCATPEGLFLRKLFALPSLYRQGNITRAAIYESDLAALLHEQDIDASPLLSVLADHLPASDLNEVSKIVDEIKAKQNRFQ